jgi:hypothetical protein
VRDALEIWEAWQQREFSAATIRADPWTAVYRPIPENADAALLAAAQVGAVTCVGMIELGEHGPRVVQGDGPAEQQVKAESRLAELDARLAVLTANENSRERIAVVGVQEGAKTPEPTQHRAAAVETSEEMEERHRDEWELVHGDYGVEELPSQLERRHAKEREAWAWRQPAFGKETLAADPWTAVYLPIPDDMPESFVPVGAFTLRDARALVREMMAATVGPNDFESVEGRFTFDKLALGPLLNRDSYTREGNFAAAGARLAELDARLEIAPEPRQTPEPMTIEAIKRDPWNAVILELPENGTPQLYEAVSIAAQTLYFTPEGELPRMPFPAPANDLEWSTLGDEIKTRWKDAADKAYEAAEALDAAREAAPQINNPGYSRWSGEPLDDHEPMTIEAIARDPWAAIRKPIPQAPGDELLKVAREAVSRCLDELKPGSDRYVGAMGRLAELEWTTWAGVSQSACKGQSHR